MLEEAIDSLGVKMGRNPRTAQDNRQTGRGNTRTLIASAFAVWALLLQSLLPVAGALASDSGNDFLIELCTTAGVQTIALDSGESTPERPLQSKTGSGCDVCVGCGCARGAVHGMDLATAPVDSWIPVAWQWTEWSDNRSDTVAGFQSRAPPVA